MTPRYAGISPQDMFATPSSIRALGLRPYTLTGYLVQLFRAHFADPAHVEEPSLRLNPPWSDAPESGIAIESVTRWLPSGARKRPAIVVSRGPASIDQLGIGNRLMGPGADDDGNASYEVRLTGSHSLFCVGDEAGEAERLACEVYRQLVQFSPVIREDLCLLRLAVDGIDRLHAMGEAEATDAYAVPVNLTYAYMESWRIAPQAPYLKRISLQSIADESV